MILLRVNKVFHDKVAIELAICAYLRLFAQFCHCVLLLAIHDSLVNYIYYTTVDDVTVYVVIMLP